MKLFSVVTVCYNCKDCIEDTIKSVISQERSLYEYIVVDGASNDGTLEIVSQYNNNIDIIISESDHGIYDAMNKGIFKASGKYVIFMNAGDTFFSPNVLKSVSETLNVESDVIFGDKCEIRDGIRYRIKARPFYKHMPLHQSMGFNHQCVFVSLDMARKFPFNLKYKLAADYDMIINIYKFGGIFQQLDLVIANFDINGVSNTKIYTHMYERLCIDYPNRLIKNRAIAWYRQFKYKVLMFVKKIVLIFAPNLINYRRERNEIFVKLETSI